MSGTGISLGEDFPERRVSNLQLLLTMQRIELQLKTLTGEKGRIPNLEDAQEAQGRKLEDHEKKINQARGALVVLAAIGGFLEIYVHKAIDKLFK